MRITSQKEVIKKLSEGFRFEEAEQYSRTIYYLTNYKDSEITVPRKTIDKLIDKGVIDWQLDYKPNAI